ncbi:MAG: hypothetical protein J6K04_02000 [Lachnospiraceae bacterium]|nr:hypothetical protein [Lachnospiraceae bacterium]MBP3567914.1 hypothetical protein [Lachnospiraceae bacterium]
MFFDFISDLVIGACDLGFKLDSAIFGDSSADADALMKVILNATQNEEAEDTYVEADVKSADGTSTIATSIEGIKKHVY